MKFNCGPTKEEKQNVIWPDLYKKLVKGLEEKNQDESWKRHFAFIPVRIPNSRICAWLEFVERRCVWEIEYECYISKISSRYDQHYIKPHYKIAYYEYRQVSTV